MTIATTISGDVKRHKEVSEGNVWCCGEYAECEYLIDVLSGLSSPKERHTMVTFQKTTPRTDQHGFWVRSLHVSLGLHWWTVYTGFPLMVNPKHGFLAELQIGRGAGYIGGASIYLGWRARGGLLGQSPSRLRLGITRNANRVPYAFA